MLKFGKRLSVAQRALIGVSSVGLLLASCGKKESDHPVGQVIAHAGADDITIQELENEFQLAKIPADKRDDAVTKKVLQELVVRKTIARQAMVAKIDREPTYQLDVLRYKEQLLGRIALQRKFSSVFSAIGQADIDQYITNHPTNFAKRVVFTTDQIAIPLQSITPELGTATKEAKSIAEVEEKLKDRKINYRHESGALDSATLPPQMVEQLQTGKVGDVFFVRAQAGGVFFKVIESQPKPLTGPDAVNLARELMGREKMEAINRQAAGDALKGATFEGDYAKIMADPKPK